MIGFGPGDRLDLGRLNRMASGAASNARGSASGRVASSGSRAGRSLRKERAEPIIGTLSGSGPIYDFAQALDNPDGSWSAGPRSGRAMEVNGVTGLAGKRATLRPDRSGGWRFQSRRYGGGGFTFHCPDTVITVLDRATGDPLPGVSVAIRSIGSPPGSVSGTTDGSGVYAPASLPAAYQGLAVDLSYMGCSASYPLPLCEALTFEVCRATLAVSTEPGATVDPGDYINSPGPVVADGSGSAAFSFCEIRPSYQPSMFPLTLRVRASLDGHTDNCQLVTIRCDDADSIDLPLFHFEPDYVPAPNNSNFLCDPGCSAGEGPDGRGLIPKKLYITLPSTAEAGSYAGVPIELDYAGQLGGVRFTWQSGCLDGADVPCPLGQTIEPDARFSGDLPCGAPYGPPAAVWPSMRAYLSYDGSGWASVTLEYHSMPGCQDYPQGQFPACSCLPTSSTLGYFPGCRLSTPCDYIDPSGFEVTE